jgi:soluble lytic murein transglycosylase-like protein
MRSALVTCILATLCLALPFAAHAATDPEKGIPANRTAEQAYRDVLMWASGNNSATYADQLYLNIERESYRYNILPEFGLAVIAAEARYGYGISWARYDSWKLVELAEGRSLKPYPNVLDDIGIALSELRQIMSSSDSVDKVLRKYWCGPRGEFNKDSYAAFAEAASKLYNALEPYARQRIAAQERDKFEQGSGRGGRDPVANPWAGLAYGDMDGYKSSMNSMPALPSQLKSFGNDEDRYAAAIKTINKRLTDAEATVIARSILTYCEQTDWRVDPRLVIALVKCESSFRPRAVSSVGALGLGQLMPATARSFGIKDPLDPVQNLYGTVRYLDREQYRWRKRRDWLDCTIASYNAGPGAVQKYNGVPPYQETRNHLKQVKGYFFKLAPEVAKAYGSR